MMKTKAIPFAEMRRLLQGLGYKEKLVDNAHVFFRSKTDMVIFRRYDDGEAVWSGDISTTRQYLDLRGIMDGSDFDAFFESVNQSA